MTFRGGTQTRRACTDHAYARGKMQRAINMRLAKMRLCGCVSVSSALWAKRQVRLVIFFGIDMSPRCELVCGCVCVCVLCSGILNICFLIHFTVDFGSMDYCSSRSLHVFCFWSFVYTAAALLRKEPKYRGRRLFVCVCVC